MVKITEARSTIVSAAVGSVISAVNVPRTSSAVAGSLLSSSRSAPDLKTALTEGASTWLMNGIKGKVLLKLLSSKKGALGINSGHSFTSLRGKSDLKNLDRKKRAFARTIIQTYRNDEAFGNSFGTINYEDINPNYIPREDGPGLKATGKWTRFHRLRGPLPGSDENYKESK